MNTDKLQKTEFGLVKPQAITEEMQKSYLDYAMSVIVSRALPDLRDGLKPVQRRILYAMKELGLTHNSAYKKSARIVGEVIGKYHPHGETAVYDALVRMSQDFSLRYPLVDGQGNFGSLDGDPPAAMRYTEAKLEKITNELLQDLKKNTIDFRDNFDGSESEPVVLPARIPNLLANGADGIAVGMATKIPPHNLNELIEALLQILERAKTQNHENLEAFKREEPEFAKRMTNFFDQYEQDAPYYQEPQITYFSLDASEITTEDLMEQIPAPDFPTGAEIYDQEEIKKAYANGKGRVLMQASTKIVDIGHGKTNIEITELPYQQNKAKLIEKIADLVKKEQITDIADLRDESDRTGLKIVVELKRSTNPQRVLNQLFKHTPMQQTYHMNMVALDNDVPRVMSLKGMLTAYLRHRKEVIIRATAHKLMNSLRQSHILEGLKIALDNLDEVIETIRRSSDSDQARLNLMESFELTEIQANAILEMQLRRLAALERERILNEYQELSAAIDKLKATLSTPQQVIKIIRQDLKEVQEKYGDKRRSRVHPGKPGEISEEALIKEEDTIIILTRGNYIKRVSPQSFSTQGRGGKGVRGGNLKKEDAIHTIRYASTHELLLFFTSRGRVFSKRVWEVSETSRTARGTPAINLIGIDPGEQITSILTIKSS